MGVNSDMLRGFHDMMILYRLSLSDSYGYEISKFVRNQTDNIYTIKETTLYSTFNRLEKQGDIRSFSKEETRGRKRTYYKLTKEGTLRYQKLAVDWVTTQEIVNHFIRSEENESH